MSNKEFEISATYGINEREFVEIKQGKYGIELKVVRENNRISIPVDTKILLSIRKCIDEFAEILSNQFHDQRKQR